MIHVPSEVKLKYVLTHFSHHWTLTEKLQKDFFEGRIVFPNSHVKNPSPKEIGAKSILVIFANPETEAYFEIIEGRLEFHHDFISSAFYLLSGQQEWECQDKDEYGRIPYTSSIQYKYDCLHIPLVNEYFSIIAEGLQLFSEFHNRELMEPINRWGNLAIMTSHDIDNIESYDFYTIGHLLKCALGLSRSRVSYWQTWRDFFFSLRKGLFSSENPAWSFPYLTQTAEDRDFKSTFFFLQQDLKHQDSYYNLEDERIVNQIADLEKNNHEVGLHGTVRSSTDAESMKKIYRQLSTVSSQKPQGIRQHRLYYNVAKTPNIQLEAGLIYDCTLGFAQHEGFRHGYCHPFQPFDFKTNTKIDMWEIPLNFMDITLYNHRKKSNEQAVEIAKELIDKIAGHKGVFGLLYHNDFFDERKQPGAKRAYERILDYAKEKGAVGLTGREIVKRIG